MNVMHEVFFWFYNDVGTKTSVSYHLQTLGRIFCVIWTSVIKQLNISDRGFYDGSF